MTAVETVFISGVSVHPCSVEGYSFHKSRTEANYPDVLARSHHIQIHQEVRTFDAQTIESITRLWQSGLYVRTRTMV